MLIQFLPLLNCFKYFISAPKTVAMIMTRIHIIDDELQYELNYKNDNKVFSSIITRQTDYTKITRCLNKAFHRFLPHS